MLLYHLILKKTLLIYQNYEIIEVSQHLIWEIM